MGTWITQTISLKCPKEIPWGCIWIMDFSRFALEWNDNKKALKKYPPKTSKNLLIIEILPRGPLQFNGYICHGNRYMFMLHGCAWSVHGHALPSTNIEYTDPA